MNNKQTTFMIICTAVCSIIATLFSQADNRKKCLDIIKSMIFNLNQKVNN